eukprot:SAG11_NODE_834_length_6941_cov_19.514762_1_plen_150_part_00
MLLLEHPLKLCQSPFPCMLQEMYVKSVVAGQQYQLGSIMEAWTCCETHLHVVDASGNVLFNVVGPCIKCDNCCCAVDFQIKRGVAGETVGKLQKLRGSALKEIFSEADNFQLQFPTGCDTTHKALLLSAVLMIDFMFFENVDKHDRNTF